MTTASVTLLFSDGVARRLDVEPGARLIEAAAEAGLTLLTDCGNGQCGTCTGRICSGAIHMDEYDRAVLPEADRDNGAVLPCVARATGPCVLELPYESAEACVEEPPPLLGRISAVDEVADETIRLEVDIEVPLAFEPGQYVRMRPPGTEQWRSYSMANRSGSTRLVFFIRLIVGGSFSGWLTKRARTGDVIEISNPHGSFFLRNEPRARLFIAGGTGLAPFLSMLDFIESHPEHRKQPTTLVMGVRTPQHLFAMAELERHREGLPNLELHFAAEKDATRECHAGYPTEIIPKIVLARYTRVYLCGPPPMIDAGRNAAMAAGIAHQDILCERFA